QPATTVDSGDDQTGDNKDGADQTLQNALNQTGSVIGEVSYGDDLYEAMANDPARPHPDRFFEMAGCFPGPNCVMPEGWVGEYGDYLPLPGEDLFGELFLAAIPLPLPTKLLALGRGAKLLKGAIKGGKAGKLTGEIAKRCNSFLPATAVLMADGTTKRIDQIKVGDKVMATDLENGKTTAQSVTKVYAHRGDELMVEVDVEERTQFGLPLHGGVIATAQHPFFERRSESWIEAGDLRPGDELVSPSKERVLVAGTRQSQISVQVYNLTVANAHTYYVLAGVAPVLVHNSNGDLTPRQLKTIDTYNALIEEHEAKLRDYLANPDAYDNKGFLKNAPSDAVRQRIIDGRAKHLRTEIETFRNNIAKITGGVC
ncbi:Hint domain-containing protein, partial [Kribbella sp. NPDC051620]|uniref:Hint domain-containing protein n=1 Tax=Kribbella sp. NPDC051620 TaxID=3364120 RepID=UPI0037A517A2